MSTISIYLNERASNSQASQWRDQIRKRLFRHDLRFNSPKNLAQLRKKLLKDIEDNVDCVFSIGGDGTANVIIQQLAGSDVKLLVVPAGTANDLAQNLGISKSINNIIKLFQRNSTSKIDLLKINDSFMATNGGFGLPTQVALDVNDYRNRYKGFKNLMSAAGGHIYSAVLVKNIVTTYREPLRKIILASEDYHGEREIEAAMVLVNNQATLGGEFIVAPDTRNDDGKFNVTVFSHKNRMNLIKCIYNIRSGKFPKDDKDFVQFETKKLEVISNDGKDLHFFGDGEILEKSKRLVIENRHKALNFYRALASSTYDVSYNLSDIAAI